MSSSINVNVHDMISLPNDIMTLYDGKFFNLIRSLGGEVVSELLKVQFRGGQLHTFQLQIHLTPLQISTSTPFSFTPTV